MGNQRLLVVTDWVTRGDYVHLKLPLLPKLFKGILTMMNILWWKSLCAYFAGSIYLVKPRNSSILFLFLSICHLFRILYMPLSFVLFY